VQRTHASRAQRTFAQIRGDWGLRRALHWRLMSVLRRFGLRLYYVHVESNLGEVRGDPEPVVPAGIVTRVVAIEALAQYAGRVDDLDHEFLKQAIARDDLCVANFAGDELVGYAFVSFTRAPVNDQLDVLVPRGFQYIYKGWTHPDYRRANLTKARQHVRRKSLLAERAPRGIRYIETHNYASLLHGYRAPADRDLPMGFCGSLTILGREIPFNSRRAKWIGFEMVRKTDTRARQYVP
jgi:hypothetical protein